MPNLVDTGLAYWRALKSRAGITAVVMTMVALFRVNRLVELVLGELPPWLSVILGPVATYVILFVAGCLLTRAVMIELRRRETPTYEPLTWLRDLAKSSGWNWEDHSHVVSFAEWLRQAGADGSLILYGRSILKSGSPLVPIPKRHWEFCKIRTRAIREATSNDDMRTDTDPHLNGGLAFQDVHVNREPAEYWLHHVAGPQKGKTRTTPH